MENIMTDAPVVAFAAPEYLCVAIVDLQVLRLAATLGDARGELRPQSGWGSFRQQTPIVPIAQGTSLRSGTSATSIEMGNVRNFKPRNGSYATSGTG